MEVLSRQDGHGSDGGDKPPNRKRGLDTSPDDDKPNKKTRSGRACDECHRQHQPCLDGRPCRRCIHFKLECTFERVPRKRGPVKGEREIGEAILGMMVEEGWGDALNQMIQGPRQAEFISRRLDLADTWQRSELRRNFNAILAGASYNAANAATATTSAPAPSTLAPVPITAAPAPIIPAPSTPTPARRRPALAPPARIVRARPLHDRAAPFGQRNASSFAQPSAPPALDPASRPTRFYEQYSEQPIHSNYPPPRLARAGHFPVPFSSAHLSRSYEQHGEQPLTYGQHPEQMIPVEQMIPAYSSPPRYPSPPRRPANSAYPAYPAYPYTASVTRRAESEPRLTFGDAVPARRPSPDLSHLLGDDTTDQDAEYELDDDM